MCVGLVAHFADIGLVGGVHVHVLLAVAAVGKASVTAFKFTFERFLTCKRKKHKGGGNMVRAWSFLELSSGRQSARRSSQRGSADWGRLWHLFSLEKNGERWLSLLGWGVVGGGRAGPAQNLPVPLFSRRMGKPLAPTKFPLSCGSTQPGPGLPTRGHVLLLPRRCNEAREGQ